MQYPEEYNTWKADMKEALSKVYTLEEAEIIVNWWDNINANQEFEWFGIDFIEALNAEFMYASDSFRVAEYRNWCARVWLYAPNILNDHRKKNH